MFFSHLFFSDIYIEWPAGSLGSIFEHSKNHLNLTPQSLSYTGDRHHICNPSPLGHLSNFVALTSWLTPSLVIDIIVSLIKFYFQYNNMAVCFAVYSSGFKSRFCCNWKTLTYVAACSAIRLDAYWVGCISMPGNVMHTYIHTASHFDNILQTGYVLICTVIMYQKHDRFCD